MPRPIRAITRYSLLSCLACLLLAASCAGSPGPSAVRPGAPDLPAPSPADEPFLMAEEAAPASRSDGASGAPPPPSAYAPSASKTAAPALAPSSAGPSRPTPSQSGLKAGYSDDNEQFNLFLGFLDQYREVEHYELGVRERIVLKVSDAAGRPVADAAVEVRAGGKLLARGKTYSDGAFALYPLEYGKAPEASSYEVAIGSKAGSMKLTVERGGPRSLPIRLEGQRKAPAPLPVDIVFVLDTTGSMGEEIERLRDTIEIINANLAGIKPRPALRFGLVLYKDKEDEYLTKTQALTADLDAFQAFLAEVTAGGGGDTPEDLQAALEVAVRDMEWRPEGLRLVFTITDAPAQLGYGQTYTYAEAAREAASQAIKLYGIGTGGLPLEGEYLLRQVAQFTRARYIFLTYGEKGEAAGGTEGSVSHHTGSNFTTDKLEAVVIRFVREEIARYSDQPLEGEDSYYEAHRVDDETREATLKKLFEEALGNLADYASARIPEGTRLALVPLLPQGDGAARLASQAEYFGEQLLMAAAGNKSFTLVERKDLQKLLEELELQLSGLADEESAARVGKFLGAELLLSGSLYEREDRYELFLKLIRVETAEVLSATKARIDKKLGL